MRSSTFSTDLQDVGFQVEVAVVADEARIRESADVADVAGTRHKGDDVPAILAGLTAWRFNNQRRLRQASGDRRQFVAPDFLGEERRLAERLRGERPRE